MKTAKIIAISGSAVGVVLFAGAAFMLYRGVAGFNKSRRELEDLKTSMERYYKAPVFPSPSNVKIETENAEQVDVWFSELTAKLAKGNVVSTDRSPSHFITAGNKIRRSLLKKAREAGTVLPDGKFAFGFERYTGANGALPKPDDIPRLIEQLSIINEISSILFESGIKEITSVKRDVFESASGDLEVSASSSSRRSRHSRSHSRSHSSSRSPQTINPGDKDVGILKEGSLFAKMHFVFEFRAKEAALIDIMNDFAKNEMFIVVTSLTISKKTPDLLPKVSDQVIKDDLAESGSDSIFDNPVVSKKKKKGDEVAKPKLGPNYPVCGIKMEIPMDIHLELDVYKFKEARFDSGH